MVRYSEWSSMHHAGYRMNSLNAGPYCVSSPSFSDNDPFNNPFVNPSERPLPAAPFTSLTEPSTAAASPSHSHFATVKQRCETVIATMKENFNRMLDRGNRMETLLDKSDRLTQTTSQFHAQSRNVEREMWWKRWIVVMVAIFVVALLMTILAYLNRFVFWMLLFCIASGLCSIVYFHIQNRHRRLNPSMPIECGTNFFGATEDANVLVHGAVNGVPMGAWYSQTRSRAPDVLPRTPLACCHTSEEHTHEYLQTVLGWNLMKAPRERGKRLPTEETLRTLDVRERPQTASDAVAVVCVVEEKEPGGQDTAESTAVTIARTLEALEDSHMMTRELWQTPGTTPCHQWVVPAKNGETTPAYRLPKTAVLTTTPSVALTYCTPPAAIVTRDACVGGQEQQDGCASLYPGNSVDKRQDAAVHVSATAQPTMACTSSMSRKLQTISASRVMISPTSFWQHPSCVCGAVSIPRTKRLELSQPRRQNAYQDLSPIQPSRSLQHILRRTSLLQYQQEPLYLRLKRHRNERMPPATAASCIDVDEFSDVEFVGQTNHVAESRTGKEQYSGGQPSKLCGSISACRHAKIVAVTCSAALSDHHRQPFFATLASRDDIDTKRTLRLVPQLEPCKQSTRLLRRRRSLRHHGNGCPLEYARDKSRESLCLSSTQG